MIFYTLFFIYFILIIIKKKKSREEQPAVHRSNKVASPTIIQFRLFVMILNKDLTYLKTITFV